MPNKEQKTIRNPAQAIGAFIVNDGEYRPVALGALIALTAASTGINTAIDNAYDVTPDTTGIAIQEELVAYHSESISKLKQQRINLEKAKTGLEIDKEFNTITPTQEKALIDLKSQFVVATEKTLMELQMKDSTAEGAGLSEENFDKLYNEALSFLEINEGKIVGTEYNARIETGMLDEYLAEIGNPSDLKDASQILNQKMNDKAEDSDIISAFAATAGGLTAGGITLLMLMFGGRYLSEKLPKRIKLPKRKGPLPSNH